MNSNKTYIGTYKVIKFFNKSGRKQILRRGLTREEAQRVVNSYPDSNTSLVGFDKQFTADKYFINNAFELKQNGNLIFTGTENECYFKLQRVQSQSADWAIKYEGYTVTKVG
tara:strand:+ start:470 stop:805 length:336 start_codon:yes stop_codon:yes gene_type:complete